MQLIIVERETIIKKSKYSMMGGVNAISIKKAGKESSERGLQPLIIQWTRNAALRRWHRIKDPKEVRGHENMWRKTISGRVDNRAKALRSGCILIHSCEMAVQLKESWREKRTTEMTSKKRKRTHAVHPLDQQPPTFGHQWQVSWKANFPRTGSLRWWFRQWWEWWRVVDEAVLPQSLPPAVRVQCSTGSRQVLGCSLGLRPLPWKWQL